MAQAKKDVVKKEGGAVSTSAPDFMKKYAGEGTEAVGSTDVEIPRLQLLQSLSKQVSDGDESAGNFYHSILEESIGKDVLIVPIYTDIRYILWRPRHDGGGILARADDGKNWVPANAEFEVKPYKDSKKTVVWRTKPTVQESGLDQWGSYDPENEESQPAATKMYNIVVHLPEHPELSPCVLTLQRGAVRVGKKFIGKLKLSGLPSYGQIYRMSSIKDNSGEGDFFNFQFEKAGFITDEAQFEEMREMYEMFHAQGINIKDLEGVQDSESARSDNEDGPIPT